MIAFQTQAANNRCLAMRCREMTQMTAVTQRTFGPITGNHKIKIRQFSISTGQPCFAGDGFDAGDSGGLDDTHRPCGQIVTQRIKQGGIIHNIGHWLFCIMPGQAKILLASFGQPALAWPLGHHDPRDWHRRLW